MYCFAPGFRFVSPGPARFLAGALGARTLEPHGLGFGTGATTQSAPWRPIADCGRNRLPEPGTPDPKLPAAASPFSGGA
jgi:hypothetical protein